MTPRLVLNYEYYTYRNDYDAVIQPPKVASEAGVSCTPVPSLCPTGRDAPPPPCERKHSVTPMVFSATPSSCWQVMAGL